MELRAGRVDVADPFLRERLGEIPLQKADASGTLSISLPLESFRLQAFAPGYRTADFGPFDPDSLGGKLELALFPGQAIRGRVVHAGRGVAGVRLLVSRTWSPDEAHDSCQALTERITAPEHPFSVLGQAKLRPEDATSGADGSFVATLHEDGWHLVRIEAEGFPPTVFGPFEWTRAGGASGLVLELPEAGAIEGRVLAAEGNGAGRLVGASNGWGTVVSAVAGEEGSFRIEDLAPGRWQVRACVPPLGAEEQLRSNSWKTSSPDSVVWDCEVLPGATTRFDLDLRDEAAFVLEGELSGGIPTEGWTAELWSPSDLDEEAADLVRSHVPFTVPLASAVLDARGRFRLALSGPERVLLGIGGDGFWMSEEIELARGTTRWSAELPIGTLRIEEARPPTAISGQGALYAVRTFGTRTVARELPQEDGVPAGASSGSVSVPSGELRLVQLDRGPDRSTEKTELETLTVPQGGEAVLRIR